MAWRQDSSISSWVYLSSFIPHHFPNVLWAPTTDHEQFPKWVLLFQTSENLAHVVPLPTLSFRLAHGQASTYTSWSSLWCGFCSQNTPLEGFLHSRPCQWGKSYRWSPGKCWALLPWQASLVWEPALSSPTLHSCRASQILKTSPFLSQSSARVHSSLKSQCMNPSTVWYPSGIKRS